MKICLLNYCFYVDVIFSFMVKYIIGKVKLEIVVLILSRTVAYFFVGRSFLQNLPAICIVK